MSSLSVSLGTSNTAEPGVAPRPGPHFIFARHYAVAVARRVTLVVRPLGDAMTADALRTILRQSERKIYRFAFVDGSEMLAEVVSATHIDADDTIVILRVGALSNEFAWNVSLSEIRSVFPLPGGR